MGKQGVKLHLRKIRLEGGYCKRTMEKRILKMVNSNWKYQNESCGRIFTQAKGIIIVFGV